MNNNDYALFQCPKCALGYRPAKVSLADFIEAEYQVNCEFCDCPMCIVDTSPRYLTIKTWNMVSVLLNETGYCVMVEDRIGNSQWPMRIVETNQILWDNPYLISETQKRATRMAYGWIDIHKNRINSCSITELG